MTMKPDNAAFLRKIDDVMVDQKYFAEGVCLTGLKTVWRPVELNIDDALSDASALLNQAIAVFDKQDDFPLEQWGAMQQLYMARALLIAAHEAVESMVFVKRDRGE